MYNHIYLLKFQVFIQLKRPSDDVTSEALPFDYLPLDSGRNSFLSFRRNIDKGNNIDQSIFQRILFDDQNIFGKDKIVNNNNLNEVILLDTPTEETNNIETEMIEPTNVIPEQEQQITSTDDLFQVTTELIENKTNDWLLKSSDDELIDEISNENVDNNNCNNFKNENTTDDDKTLTELLEQVAELDEIYSDHQLRRDDYFIENELKQLENSLEPSFKNDEQTMEIDDLFDDAATYSSLQKAFKNPVDMIDIQMPDQSQQNDIFMMNGYNDQNNYDFVDQSIIINPSGPVIDVSPLKRESIHNVEEEKLPPLPPKRVKKVLPDENNENKPTNVIIQKMTDDFSTSRRSSTRSITPRPQSQIIIMKSPEKKLPPKPMSVSTTTLNSTNKSTTGQKKTGFFSKLFSRKKSKNDITSSSTINPTTPLESREPSIGNLHSVEAQSVKSLPAIQKLKSNSMKQPRQFKQSNSVGKPVGRSVSSVSGKRPHLTADIVHIPLKGESTNSLPRITGSGTHLSLPGNENLYETSSTITLSKSDRHTVSALQLADLPMQDGDMELIAIADAQSLKNLCEGGEYGVELGPNVDLTEAEHYALYTSIPPQATASEFDETSCYYAPVEAGEILTPAEVAKRLTNNL